MAQVSDFNVANASGASVRSDINAILEAIKTCNSGGSDPSNPEQFMFYADTADNNNLKIRNAANNAFTTIGSVDEANLGLLPKAGGTMTGQLLELMDRVLVAQPMRLITTQIQECFDQVLIL